jgi:hypothetical protein
MMPFAMEQGAKGMPQRQKMTFTKVELNVPMEESRFKMPAAAAAADTTRGAAGDTKAEAAKAAEAGTEAARKPDAKTAKAAKGKKKDN